MALVVEGISAAAPRLPSAPPSSSVAPDAELAASAACPRKPFLAGLLQEDVGRVARWHCSRPRHEQRRFLRSVDALHRRACRSSSAGALAPPCRGGDRRASATRGPARGGASALAAARGRAASVLSSTTASRPSRAEEAPEPIIAGVPGLPLADGDGPVGAGENSLLRWLDGGSAASSASTASSPSCRLPKRPLSAATLSSIDSSVCSDPRTMQQADFRFHRRALEANRNSWSAVNQHLDGGLNGGVPNDGFPDTERLPSKRASGKVLTQKVYGSVLRDTQQPLVDEFLQNATTNERENFARMVRSLDSLRRERAKETTSLSHDELNLAENARLHQPSRARPVYDEGARNHSSVPLGAPPPRRAPAAEAAADDAQELASCASAAPSSLPSYLHSSACEAESVWNATGSASAASSRASRPRSAPATGASARAAAAARRTAGLTRPASAASSAAVPAASGVQSGATSASSGSRRPMSATSAGSLARRTFEAQQLARATRAEAICAEPDIAEVSSSTLQGSGRSPDSSAPPRSGEPTSVGPAPSSNGCASGVPLAVPTLRRRPATASSNGSRSHCSSSGSNALASASAAARQRQRPRSAVAAGTSSCAAARRRESCEASDGGGSAAVCARSVGEAAEAAETATAGSRGKSVAMKSQCSGSSTTAAGTAAGGPTAPVVTASEAVATSTISESAAASSQNSRSRVVSVGHLHWIR
eukprot:TRINITY_DN55337_c0_g1_i1.p1 TRINITY_DN55337_c0_g1~~TRINITY_DN55337_c0_g1_i1.p1  ORF type:complete len:710 (-),score=143.64 TRINITY_DN55337_c0_g1_i1:188-2317(-)